MKKRPIRIWVARPTKLTPDQERECREVLSWLEKFAALHDCELIQPDSDHCPNDTADSPTGELFPQKRREMLDADLVVGVAPVWSGGHGLMLEIAWNNYVPTLFLHRPGWELSRISASRAVHASHIGTIRVRGERDLERKMKAALDRHRQDMVYIRRRWPARGGDHVVGVNVRKLRERQRKSQRSLARYLGVSLDVVKGIEAGLYDLTTRQLRVIAAYFEATPESLLGDEHEYSAAERRDRIYKFCIDHQLKLVVYDRLVETYDQLTRRREAEITRRTSDRALWKIVNVVCRDLV